MSKEVQKLLASTKGIINILDTVSRLAGTLSTELLFACDITMSELYKAEQQIKPLQLQVGKKYRSADGEVFLIVREASDRFTSDHTEYMSASQLRFLASGKENGGHVQLVEEVAE